MSPAVVCMVANMGPVWHEAPAASAVNHRCADQRAAARAARWQSGRPVQPTSLEPDMPFTTRRPKIDVDTEKIKDQAADLGAAIADEASHAKGTASVAAGKAGVAAVQAKDWTGPKVEAFGDWLLPRLEHLYKESVKAAAPKVEAA